MGVDLPVYSLDLPVSLLVDVSPWPDCDHLDRLISDEPMNTPELADPIASQTGQLLLQRLPDHRRANGRFKRRGHLLLDRSVRMSRATWSGMRSWRTTDPATRTVQSSNSSSRVSKDARRSLRAAIPAHSTQPRQRISPRSARRSTKGARGQCKSPTEAHLAAAAGKHSSLHSPLMNPSSRADFGSTACVPRGSPPGPRELLARWDDAHLRPLLPSGLELAFSQNVV
jgi:hypothetical protein